MLPLQVLYSSVLPLQLLYSSDHSALLVVYCTFLSPTFVRLLQSHLLQSCPWPHHSRDHPHRWCPLTSPNRDLPGYIAQWFWLVYILMILFFLDHSVCFIHLDRLSFCYIYMPYDLSVSYIQFIWVRWYFSVVPFSTFHRRPERMWTRLRSRWPPREGSHLPLHPPNLHPNDPDWTVPHLWQDL